MSPGSHERHPFLRGNFAPVEEEYISFPCTIVAGEIPTELLGGQYIRNGGNPVHPPDQGRHYHWFDGDGMLHGVLFPPASDPTSPPLYTNRHLSTPLLNLTLVALRSPIPSIALLISPLSSLHRIGAAIVQAFFVALRARLGVLSVANTSLMWWGQGLGSDALAEDEEVDKGAEEEEERATRSLVSPRPMVRRESSMRRYRKDHRLLAMCESGPPLEVRVPELETVGWDRLDEAGTRESLSTRRGRRGMWTRWGLPRVQEDWMTAHPRIDPVDGSLLLYSCQMFDAPHVRYSVIDRTGKHLVWKQGIDVGRAKMMHDFAATRTHTILLNLPLTLSPANLFSLHPTPLIHFDRTLPSEFIIFPRLLGSAETPQRPVRFRDPEPSLIFHTANAWDEYAEVDQGGEAYILGGRRKARSKKVVAVNLVAPRFKSAKLVYSAGAVDVPPEEKKAGIDDVVLLYYYRFLLPDDYHSPDLPPTSIKPGDSLRGSITHMFPLTAIPFEFPTVPENKSMSDCRYVYGCTMRSGSFDERLGGAAKVDCLAKIDVRELVRRGKERADAEGEEGRNQARSGEGRSWKSAEPVDGRSAQEIISDGRKGIRGPVELFPLPSGWYAQETRFVPRPGGDEDDGYLVCYVYDESFILDDGVPSKAPDAGSELWVIDAKRMGDGMDAVACRIKLPQRVPYGLHGTWLPPSLARHQRPLRGPLPAQPLLQHKLAKSRLSHFVSILFDRPRYRARPATGVERVFLAIFWPLGVGVLVLAMAEVGALVYRGGSGGARVGMEREGKGMEHTWSHKGSVTWPQVIAVVLVLLTAILRYPRPKTVSNETPSTPPFQEVDGSDDQPVAP